MKNTCLILSLLSSVYLFSQQLDLSKWALVTSKSDEFNNLTNLWKNDSQDLCWSNFQSTYYNPSNNSYVPISFAVVNGQLVTTNKGLRITTKKTQQPVLQHCPTWDTVHQYLFKFESGSIYSDKLYHYGYYEIRAITPVSDKAAGSAFWLWNQDCYIPIPSYGEIDVFENRSNEPTISIPNVHIGDCIEYSKYVTQFCATNDCRSQFDYGANLTGAYHTYGLNWQKDFVEFYIDNYLFRKYTNAQSTDSVYTSLNNLNLPLQVVLYGYNCANSASEEVDVNGSNFIIDYFRYYKMKPYISSVSSSLVNNKISIITTSGVENDTYSLTFTPNCSYTASQSNGSHMFSFPLDLNNRTVSINSGQIIPQRHIVPITSVVNGVSHTDYVNTLAGSPNSETILSNNVYAVNKNTTNVSLNNPVSKTIYVAPNIECPQIGSSSILTGNGEFIFNAINAVTLNPGFELSLGSTLYIETINP